MRCANCGVRIQRSNFMGSWSHDWIHVTANGDRLSTYCEIQQATPPESAAKEGGL